MEEITKLQLIQTDELMDELFSRFDSAIFISHRYDTKNESQMSWNTKGNKYMLLGLVEYLTELVRSISFSNIDEGGIE